MLWKGIPITGPQLDASVTASRGLLFLVGVLRTYVNLHEMTCETEPPPRVARTGEEADLKHRFALRVSLCLSFVILVVVWLSLLFVNGMSSNLHGGSQNRARLYMLPSRCATRSIRSKT